MPEVADTTGLEERLVPRLASAADVPELVRLRRIIFEGHPAEHRVEWVEHCAEYLRDRLDRDEPTLCAAVIGDPRPGGRLAACAVGWIDHHLPSPVSELGTLGYIGSVTTDSGYRGRGLATRALALLMKWFEQQGVPRVELQTTPDAFALYRRFGFEELSTPAMRWYRGGRPGVAEEPA